MDKLILVPDEVRGLGDVVSPTSASSFRGYASVVSSVSESVDGNNLPVYSLGGKAGSYLVYSDGAWITPSDGVFSVSVTLKKASDDSVVGSASVKCIVDDSSVLTATTNSSGVASFTISTADHMDCIYHLRFIYNGDTNLSGCFKDITLATGADNDFDLSLVGEKPIIQTGENDYLVASIMGTDCNNNPAGVPGQTVYFYEEWTPGIQLGSDKSIIESGDEATISAQLVDTSDGSLVRESGVTIYFFEKFTPNVRLSADASIIQDEESSNLSGQLIDNVDGSLVRESGRTVYYYEVVDIVLTADKTELSIPDSETATLTVTVTSPSGRPFSNKEVSFVKETSTVATATTDSNGVATYTYTSENVVGARNFKAVVNGMNSNTVSIYNCLFIDTALTDKSSSYGSAGNASLTYDSTNKYYKLLTTANNTNNWFELSNKTFPRNAVVSLDFKFDSANWEAGKEVCTGFRYGSFIAKAAYNNQPKISVLDTNLYEKDSASPSLELDKWYTLEFSVGGWGQMDIAVGTLTIKDGSTELASCSGNEMIPSGSTSKFYFYVGYSDSQSVCVKNLRIRNY